MTREIPAGSMEWIEDSSPSPEDVAIAQEELEARLLATSPKLRHHVWGCGLVLLGMTAWTCDPAQVVGYTPKQSGLCPGCGDARLRPGRHCIVCSSDHRDPTQRPMRDSKAEDASRKADLAGGTGKAVPIQLKRRKREPQSV